MILLCIASILREGLVFDTEGNIIPCNSMHQVKLGKWKQYFSSAGEFLAFWNSDILLNYYNNIAGCAIPDETCLSNCTEWSLCGGGCLSNWYNYSFSELHEAQKENSQVSKMQDNTGSSFRAV